MFNVRLGYDFTAIVTNMYTGRKKSSVVLDEHGRVVFMQTKEFGPFICSVQFNEHLLTVC